MNNNNLDVLIESSVFINNYGLNGGAIYIYSDNFNESNNTFLLKNTTFLENKAKYMGGSIFINYDKINFKGIDKVNFEMNKAYAGGAIYINNTNIPFKLENDYIYVNNLAESHGNEYASIPYKIELISHESNEMTLISGESCHLEFYIYDKFKNIIIDYSKIYSNLSVRAYNNNTNFEENVDYKIYGNICYFSQGNFINIYNYTYVYRKYNSYTNINNELILLF